MNYIIYAPGCPPPRRALVRAANEIEHDTGYYRQLLDLTGAGDNTLNALLPRVASLEISSACQLSCAYCPCGPDGVLPAGEILLRRMADLAADGVQALTLHYLGEPLLHPAFAELLAAAVARFPVVTLATNGLALDAAARAALLAHPPTRIGLTVDATHAAAGAAADRVLAALAELRRAREARGPAPSPVLVVQSIITDADAPSRAEVEHWLTIADAVELRSLVPVRDPAAVPSVAMPEGYCQLAFHRAVVRQDGRVQMCCQDFAGELTFGNLDAAPLAEIWRGKPAWHLRRRLLAGNWPAPCRDCVARTGVRRAPFLARARALAAEPGAGGEL